MKKINYWCLFLLFFIFFGCITDKENNYLEAKSYKIIGESLVFNNTEGNCLIKNNISNLTLYSIDSKRNRIYYKENIDYVVTKNRIKIGHNHSKTIVKCLLKLSKKPVDRLDKKNYYKDNKNIWRIRDDDYRKHERII